MTAAVAAMNAPTLKSISSPLIRLLRMVPAEPTLAHWLHLRGEVAKALSKSIKPLKALGPILRNFPLESLARVINHIDDQVSSK